MAWPSWTSTNQGLFCCHPVSYVAVKPVQVEKQALHLPDSVSKKHFDLFCLCHPDIYHHNCFLWLFLLLVHFKLFYIDTQYHLYCARSSLGQHIIHWRDDIQAKWGIFTAPFPVSCFQAWHIHGDNILDPILILVAALALIWIYTDIAEQNWACCLSLFHAHTSRSGILFWLQSKSGM